MFKKITCLALLFACSLNSFAKVDEVFTSSATGTTSATVFVPKGGRGTPAATGGVWSSGVAEVTDLAWRIDSTVTSAFIGQYIGQKKFIVNSSTAANASVIWFANNNSDVAASEFIIFYDESANDYYLRRVSAATTTSITLYSSIDITTTTTDQLWSVGTVWQKPVGYTTSASNGSAGLWFPAGAPAALVIDGNTTSCSISISGRRGELY